MSKTIRVEIVPGRITEVSLPDGAPAPPAYVIAKLVPVDGTGLMRAVPIEWTPQITLNSTNMRKLGIHIPLHALRRLIKAGLVRGSVVGVRITTIDIASLYQHLEATRLRDGSSDFWTPDKVNAYCTAFSPLRECMKR